jgi:hypothetical protein
VSRSTRRPKQNVWTRKERGPTVPALDSGHSPIALWRDGVVLPLIPALFGFSCLVSGHFKYRSLVLDGGPARALGVAALAFGASIHFHTFWGTGRSLSPYSQPALVAGGALFLAMLAFIAYATLF